MHMLQALYQADSCRLHSDPTHCITSGGEDLVLDYTSHLPPFDHIFYAYGAAHALLAASNYAPELFVHGDLRPLNFLMDAETGAVRIIIDFDWAGKEGEARYPENLSPPVRWPPGAKPGGFITRAHDLYWVDKLFSSSGKPMIRGRQ
ncbi:hypothetical protein C8Q76DRAFT_801659 [Earliella scabrosa]|nr:hypothetical protein C8Q76DRAFT_801659 [Earliella scabrosa]